MMRTMMTACLVGSASAYGMSAPAASQMSIRPAVGAAHPQPLMALGNTRRAQVGVLAAAVAAATSQQGALAAEPRRAAV